MNALGQTTKRDAKPIRVLVAERDRRLRAAIRALILGDRSITVVAETANGSETLRLAQKLRPDIVIIGVPDSRAPDLETARRLRRRVPATRIIVLCGNPTEARVRQALRAGVKGYLVIDSGRRLPVAMRTVMAGEDYFSPVVSRLVRKSLRDHKRNSRSLERLTPRQREVLSLIAEGHSNKQIAPILGVALKTVDCHRTRLMKRLRIHNATGLVRYAINTGLVPAEH